MKWRHLQFLAVLMGIFFSLQENAQCQAKLLPKNSVSRSKNKSQIHFITIAVNSFKDPFWPELKWAEQDAQKFSQVVAGDNQDMGTLNFIGADATKSNIMKKLTAYASKIKSRDSVILYVSTHGTLQKSRGGEFERYVVVQDTKNNLIAKTGLSHAWLRGWLEGLAAKKRAGIFATCFSGVGKSKLPSQVKKYLSSLKGAEVPLEEISEGFLILSASTMSEPAEESDQLQGDVYTHFLLEGLDTYDRNRDGAYGLLEAHDYATQKTFGFTEGRQKPSVTTEQVGIVDIYLRGNRKKKGLPVLYGYDKEFEGMSVEINGTVKGTLPTAVPLKVKSNTIELTDTETSDVIATYELSAKSGEQINIEDLLRPPPFYIGIAGGVKIYLANSILEENSTFGYSAEFGWQIESWRFSAMLSRGSSSSTSVKEDLAFESSTMEFGLGASYFPLQSKKYALGVTGRISYASMSVDFTESELGGEVSKDRSTFGLSLGIEGEIAISSSIGLFASSSYSFGQYDFGKLGELDSSNVDSQVGIRYYFGARAKKL